MDSSMKAAVLAVHFVLFAPSLATAQTAPLQLGEIVRPLALGTPVQGELPGPDYAIVLEFWATWCEPCRETIPHLNALKRVVDGQPVRFVHVSYEPAAKIREFLPKYPIEGTVTSAPDHALAAAIRYDGIPTTVLLDRRRRLVTVTEALRLTSHDLKSLAAGSAVRLGDSRLTSERSSGLAQVQIRPSLEDGEAVESDEFYRGTGVRIGDLLSWAYQIPVTSISLPDEVAEVRYDVAASVPPGRGAPADGEGGACGRFARQGGGRHPEYSNPSGPGAARESEAGERAGEGGLSC